MNKLLQTKDFRFNLERYPLQRDQKLQAWDAADEYLISHLEQTPLAPNAHLLIFNDNFGALTCFALAQGWQVTTVNDSLVAQHNISSNLATNELLPSAKLNLLSSLASLPDDIDLAIMKLPKNNRLLVWQLQQLAQHNQPNLALIAGAKAKDIHSSTLNLFERYFGATTTSLAVKKARLIFSHKQVHLSNLPSPTTQFEVKEYDITLNNHPNVFSAERLDIAAYLMLQHIPCDTRLKHIIDLGCGNGVLAIEAAKINPQAKITAIDESYMAIASADLNFAINCTASSRYQGLVNNCLTGIPAASADLILCNPPFHQQHAITDHIAWQMFCDAKNVLEPQGRLLVIGNRHLGYHAKLKRLFGNSRVIAANAKFVIVESYKK